MKKVIVTGYNGYIGALLIPLLLENGYEAVGIDTNFFDKDCEFYTKKFQITERKLDIRLIDEDDIEGAYAICHLAALSNDPLGELNPLLTKDINHLASVRLAKLAKKVGVEKFIFSSSCSLYGISDGATYLTEEAEFNPVTAYAKSKVETEKSIMEMSDANFSVTSLRNTTAYGISPKLRLDVVVNNLIASAVSTGEIRILSDGTPWRPLIHAEDIARAFVAVLDTPKEKVSGEAFNVGITSENFQIKDIAEAIKGVIPGCEVAITGEHGGDSRTYQVNFDKITRCVPQFMPAWTLKDGIEEIYLYFKNYAMDLEKFSGRYFIRLKQIKFLLDNNKVNKDLYWQ